MGWREMLYRGTEWNSFGRSEYVSRYEWVLFYKKILSYFLLSRVYRLTVHQDICVRSVAFSITCRQSFTNTHHTLPWGINVDEPPIRHLSPSHNGINSFELSLPPSFFSLVFPCLSMSSQCAWSFSPAQFKQLASLAFQNLLDPIITSSTSPTVSTVNPNATDLKIR